MFCIATSSYMINLAKVVKGSWGKGGKGFGFKGTEYLHFQIPGEQYFQVKFQAKILVKVQLGFQKKLEFSMVAPKF